MSKSFAEIAYRRPDFTALQKELRRLIAALQTAHHVREQLDLIQEINIKRNVFASLASLAHIRHTVNTQDAFYEAEQNFFDETEPLYEELITEYYRALVRSPLRPELEKLLGSQLFSLAEMSLQAFSPAVIPEMQQENKLASRYKKLLASASILFDGQERNLSQLGPYLEAKDRTTRKAAAEARFAFFSDHVEEFDDMYDQLVQVRTDIARKLGFADFTRLGYLRRSRADYNHEDVHHFRQKIEKYIVPVATQLRREQAKRLGIEELKFYDEALFYPGGNPQPIGDPEAILAGGKQMYAELSDETGRFFQEMIERGQLDLLSRKAKSPGGYCDYLAAYQAPFIFANFNGTSGDVDVLTHEAGHAFQVWLCRKQQIPEYHFATMESAEIPSMGMEFFAWPWMETFFGERADAYRFAHLQSSFLFLPYGALVDHFQHEVYANPALSPAQRRAAWRSLEKRYLPHRDYDGHAFLESGGYWFGQGHIFEVPFYYIDYVLAQTCVFELWQRLLTDRRAAWQDYLALCRAGGSQPFTNLLPLAKLSSPFTGKTVENAAGAVSDWVAKQNKFKKSK